MVHTAYGAHYDPKKCSVTTAYWKGHRRFYVKTVDHGCFNGGWFRGSRPVMLSYGSTTAPWYPTSHAHHGIDIDMPVGTPIYSAASGRAHIRPPSLGSAYGKNRMLVRSGGFDYVLGHMSKVTVRNGAWVTKGQLIGYSGVSGVENEDGPHLHFEKRPAAKGYRSAVNPRASLGMVRA